VGVLHITSLGDPSTHTVTGSVNQSWGKGFSLLPQLSLIGREAKGLDHLCKAGGSNVTSRNGKPQQQQAVGG